MTEAIVLLIFGGVLCLISGVIGYVLGYESRTLDEKKSAKIGREMDEHAQDWDRLSHIRKKKWD